MNGQINVFEKVLQKLALRTPLDDKIKAIALSYKRKALVITLKNFGDYTFTYGIILRFYFAAKRMGYSLSVIQCKIILAAASAVISFAVASAVYFSLKPLHKGAGTEISFLNKDKIITQDTIPQKPKDEIKSDSNYYKTRTSVAGSETSNLTAISVKTRIGIETFSGTVPDGKLLNDITNKIAAHLIELKGKKKIIRISDKRKKINVNFLLTGSVEKLGNTYIINSKLINIENSEVIFITSEEVKEIDKTDQTCSNIAEKTASYLK